VAQVAQSEPKMNHDRQFDVRYQVQTKLEPDLCLCSSPDKFCTLSGSIVQTNFLKM